MTLIKNAPSKHKVQFFVFLKIVTFIFLSWTCSYKNDENVLSKTLENGNKVNISLAIRNYRLLTKHVYQNEMPTRGLQKKVSYNRDSYQIENGKGNNNTFAQLKQGRSNNVENYLKSYKNRYSKKKGLSKLDCYCEKIVIDKIHGLYGIGEKLMNEKKSFKNFFLKKYGISLMLFALIPALGLIYPILFGVENYDKAIIMFCRNNSHTDSGKSSGCDKYHEFNWEPFLRYIKPAVSTFMFTMIIIILIFIFYAFIKVVKYEKLREGKSKMSVK